jgi:hypothetical protein
MDDTLESSGGKPGLIVLDEDLCLKSERGYIGTRL